LDDTTDITHQTHPLSVPKITSPRRRNVYDNDPLTGLPRNKLLYRVW
jgi:hypothetical protein